MENMLRIRNFPVSFFAIILGLSGLSIVSQKLKFLLGEQLQWVFFSITITIFVILLAMFTFKLISHRDSLISDFYHPIKINFFPTISISFLLFSIFLLPHNKDISFYSWLLGTILHFMFTIKILSVWIYHEHFELKHINPSWFIPIVGNIIVPVAGSTHAPLEVSWFFFSIGIIFWIVLFTVFIYRIIFHNPLPQKLLPTFFIMIAPPAIGLIAYIKLGNELDAFANVLYFFALFLAIFLIYKLPRFYRIKFFLSWWAYTFPLAAISLASVQMYHLTDKDMYMSIAAGFFVLLVFMVMMLSVKTVKAVIKKELCVEE